MRPSAVSRAPLATPICLPFLRRISMALSTSPPASVRAALQSIIGWLVRSRRALTSAAGIVVMGSFRPQSVPQGVAWRPPPVATDHGQRAADGGLFNDRRGGLGVRGGGAGGGRRGGRGAGGDAAARRVLLLGRQRGAAVADGVGELAEHQL